MTRAAHDLIQSLHAVELAKTLMAAERTLLPDDLALIEATWRTIGRPERERYNMHARTAIRGLSDPAKAVASYEARELFMRMLNWMPNSFQYSQLEKAFTAALAQYQQHLAEGPFPVGEPTPAEQGAYDAGVMPLEDDLIREDLTGHGRF